MHGCIRAYSYLSDRLFDCISACTRFCLHTHVCAIVVFRTNVLHHRYEKTFAEFMKSHSGSATEALQKTPESFPPLPVRSSLA